MGAFHVATDAAMTLPDLARGAVTLGALALSAAPLGVFLVQRRLSLMGDAMSHGILPGAAIGYLIAGLSAPVMAIGGLVAGVTVAFMASAIARHTPIREDASLAGVYMVALALGALIMMASGAEVDLVHVLFGDGQTVSADSIPLILAASSLTLLAFPWIYRGVLIGAVDPDAAQRSRALTLAHYAFLALTVINLIAAFLAVGSLLGVAVMVFPAICARLWAATIDRMIWIAALIGLIGVVVGLVCAYLTHLPPGPVVVLVLGVLFALSLLLGAADGWIARRRLRQQPHLEA
jgi:zinc/manganese transport system permease protein